MLITGKTKTIKPLAGDVGLGEVTNTDHITAGDGKKCDTMTGKAAHATKTNCNVMELLRKHEVPIAYVGRTDHANRFITKMCTMIPVEVVVRGIATGSYLKRNPKVSDGTVLEPPVLEFFYKTTNCKLGHITLPCDDPIMVRDDSDSGWGLFKPGDTSQNGFIGSLEDMVGDTTELTAQLAVCGPIALQVFEILAEAWRKIDNAKLYDFKLEFGVLPDGQIVVADVIDCDSWRVIWKGKQLSKQGYREGADLSEVIQHYRTAANLTFQFIS